MHEAGNINRPHRPALASFCPIIASVTPPFFPPCSSPKPLSAALRPEGPLDECVYPDLGLWASERSELVQTILSCSASQVQHARTTEGFHCQALHSICCGKNRRDFKVIAGDCTFHNVAFCKVKGLNKDVHIKPKQFFFLIHTANYIWIRQSSSGRSLHPRVNRGTTINTIAFL